MTLCCENMVHFDCYFVMWCGQNMLWDTWQFTLTLNYFKHSTLCYRNVRLLGLGNIDSWSFLHIVAVYNQLPLLFLLEGLTKDTQSILIFCCLWVHRYRWSNFHPHTIHKLLCYLLNFSSSYFWQQIIGEAQCCLSLFCNIKSNFSL